MKINSCNKNKYKKKNSCDRNNKKKCLKNTPHHCNNKFTVFVETAKTDSGPTLSGPVRLNNKGTLRLVDPSGILTAKEGSVIVGPFNVGLTGGQTGPTGSTGATGPPGPPGAGTTMVNVPGPSTILVNDTSGVTFVSSSIAVLSGQSVYVSISVPYTTSQPGFDLSYQLFRDGTLLYSQTKNITNPDVLTMCFIDILPGSGTHIYEIRLIARNTSMTLDFTSSAFNLIAA